MLNELISVARGFDLVPANPKEWKGRAPSSSGNMVDIFGDTVFQAINFTYSGTIEIYNDQNVERTFTYFLFRHNDCGGTTIIINPNENHYYEVANATYQTAKTNETMVSYMNRCFYYVISIPYNVTFTIKDTENRYDNLYFLANPESSLSNNDKYYQDTTFSVYNSLFIKWTTDTSNEFGLVRFEFKALDANPGNFLKLYGSNVYIMPISNDDYDTSSSYCSNYEEYIYDCAKDVYNLLVGVMVCIWIIMIIVVTAISIGRCCNEGDMINGRIDARFDELMSQIQTLKQSTQQQVYQNPSLELPPQPEYGAQPTSPYTNEGLYSAVPNIPYPPNMDDDKVPPV
jgi:hypothetical protein